jgi:hypothetical protein
MNFPQDWPNDCPPPDAVAAAGEVFRLVKTNPPTAADLASHRETGRLPNAPPCLRCGLSVFRDVQDAVHQQRLIPKLGRWIARGTLSVEHGQTKQTPSQQPTHTTWWAYEGINRAALFTVVGEEG